MHLVCVGIKLIFLKVSINQEMSNFFFIETDPKKLWPFYNCLSYNSPYSLSYKILFFETQWTQVRQLHKNGSISFLMCYYQVFTLDCRGKQQTSGMVCQICVLVTQSCPTLCNPMDCSLPGSSVRGIFQARILEWVVIFPPSLARDKWHKFWTIFYLYLYENSV